MLCQYSEEYSEDGSCQRNNESTFNRLSCLSFHTQRNNKSSMSQYLEKYRVRYEEPCNAVLFILRGIYNQEVIFSIRKGIGSHVLSRQR